MSATSPPRPPSRGRFFLAAATIPFVLALPIGWAANESARSVAAQVEAARSFERERAQAMLLSALKDAETAQRGFLLTGDPAFLGPYDPARAEAQRLRVGIGAAVDRLVAAKFAELDATIAAFRAGDIAAARRAVASGEGKQIMDQLRREVSRAGAAERARTAERLDAFARHRNDSYQLMIVSVAMMLLVLVAVVVALWRSRCEQYLAASAAHEVAERHAAILASTSDTLLIVNPSGSIEMVNAAGAALLGYAPEDLQHRDLSTVLQLGSGAGDFHTRIGLRDGRLPRDFLPEQPVRRRDGSEVSVDVTVGVMRVPDGDHLVLSLRDASERRRLERAKDELISTVSHELRTPLTSVVGSLALLRAGTESGWSAQERRLIDIADNNARRLIRLINDMLDIDRIESGQMPMARLPIDLRDITAQAALDGEGLAHSRGVTLHDDPASAAIMVAGDAGRLLQVVSNLVSNAIHASTNGDRVMLRARTANGRATVGIEDRGPGVPAALRPRLFDRFQSQRTSGGTGLGLAIAREIVRRMGGTIWFEDRTGGGTRFVFDLPLLVAPVGDVANEGGLPLVLHVDDDPDLRETIAVALTGIAEVVPAAGVAAARTILRERHPQLALLDMQVVDGHAPALIPDLIDRCGRTLPIVILSGQEVPPELAARAAVVLTKGRDGVVEVADTIRRLLMAGMPR